MRSSDAMPGEGVPDVSEAPAPARRHHPLTVAAAAMITPRFRRIRLEGPMTRALAEEAPGAWIKLYPEEDGQPSKVGRAYTIRAVSPDRGAVDLDILVDHEGPLSRWGRAAGPGDRVFAAGPGRGYRAPPGIRRHLLLGDASAVPAILSIVESLPEGDEARVLIAVDDPRERQAATTRAELRLDWLLPEGTGRSGERLVSAFAAMAPDAATHVWTAADVDTVSALRRHALQSLRLQRSLFHGAGYWKRGAEDFSDLSGDWN